MIAESRPTTLREVYEAYCLRNLGRRRHTNQMYECVIRAFERFLGREAALADLDEFTALRYREWRLTQVCAATVNRDMRHLKPLAHFAIRLGWVELKPWSFDPIPVDTLEPEAWTLAELERLLAAVNRHRKPGRRMNRSPLDCDEATLWTALLLAAYDTGARIDVLFGLKRTAFDGQFLRLPADSQKHRREQLLRVSEQTRQAMFAIDRECGTSRERLFPWYVGTRHLRETLKLKLRAAGLPDSRRDLWHKLRRTTATHFASIAGAHAAQSQLGHSTIRVTERYLDRRQMGTAYAADVLPRPRLPEPK